MTIKVKDSDSTLRTITRMVIADAGGTLRTVRTVKVMDSGSVLRTVATLSTPLTVTADPATVEGLSYGPGSASATTSPVTASPSGGLTPFSYAWTRLSGSGDALSSTLATTEFRADVPADTTLTGTFRVTVTDSAAQTATADVTASFTNTYSGGGL